jgi:hypothetical protein
LWRLDRVQFNEAMGKFFNSHGDMKLPQEFYNEFELMKQWKGPRRSGEQERLLQGAN